MAYPLTLKIPRPLFSVPLAPDSGVQQPPYNSEAGAAPAEAQPGEPGMNAAPPFDGPAETLEPVVGDFLKMQFVEHRVVPTILVCSPSLAFSFYQNSCVYKLTSK